jgi:flagellar basal body rod protein FlgG
LLKGYGEEKRDMDIGAYIAASGAMTKQRILEYVTHNLANASTPGFKRVTAQVEAVPVNGAQARASGSDALSFVRLNPPVHIDEQGRVEPTGLPLDVAIEGKGFFQVLAPEGTLSTRDGRFGTGPDGAIVSTEGHPVLDENGKELRVEAGKMIEITPDGGVRSGGAGVGRLLVADRQGTPLEEGEYRVHQGFLEASNVEPVKEMVRLMELMRSHDSYMKLMQGLGDLEEKLIQEVGRF